ncbi:hypothetical protein GQ600_16201 [Phytophthora cactorum]|nr:hypothetical protein GQ600_16201 [Phytophthora cactorum]
MVFEKTRSMVAASAASVMADIHDLHFTTSEAAFHEKLAKAKVWWQGHLRPPVSLTLGSCVVLERRLEQIYCRFIPCRELASHTSRDVVRVLSRPSPRVFDETRRKTLEDLPISSQLNKLTANMETRGMPASGLACGYAIPLVPLPVLEQVRILHPHAVCNGESWHYEHSRKRDANESRRKSA